WLNDQASFRRVPLRLDAYLSFRAGPGRVEPGVSLGVDLLLVSVAVSAPTTGAELGGGTPAAPFAGGALGCELPLGQRLFLRAMARGGVAVPYSFVATPQGAEVWSTPRTYLEFGVESGVSFP